MIIEGLALADLNRAPPADSSVPLRSISSKLCSIALKQEGYEEDLFELLRMLDCYSSLSFTAALRPIVIELAAETTLLTPSQRRRAFVGNAVASLVSLPIMHALAREDYFAFVQGCSVKSELIVPIRWRLSQEGGTLLTDYLGGGAADYPLRLRRQFIRQHANAELNAGDLPAAVSTIATSYLNDPQMFLMLPISACAELLDEDNPTSMGSPLTLAVVYDLYPAIFWRQSPLHTQ